MLNKITILLFILIGIKLSAQNCDFQLSGKIISNDAEIINHATLTLIDSLDNDISITSDYYGNYYFNNLCNGYYTLIINHDEYDDENIQINIDKNIIKNIELSSIMDTDRIEAITIQTTKNRIQTNTENFISKEQINKYSETNLGTALKEISGVNSFSTGNHIVKPVIHGLHSSRVPIFNNGIRQEDQQWGVEHAPNIDINAMNSIKVIKGSGALQYSGEAIGGIVISSPKELTKKDTIFGDILTSWVDNGKGGNIVARIEKGFKNGLAFRVQETYKKIGNLKAPDYNLSNTATEERNFSTQIGYSNNKFGVDGFYSFYNTETGILRASHIGSLEELINAINIKEPTYIQDYSSRVNPPKQEIHHHLAKLSTCYNFSLGKLLLTYAYQQNNRKEFDIRRAPYNNIPSVNLELKTHTLNLDFNHKNISGFKGKLGINMDYQKNYPNPETGVSALIPDYKKYHFGAYLIESYNISNAFMIEGGIRYDYNKLDTYKFYKKERWRALGYDKLFPNLVIKDVGLSYLIHSKLDFNSLAATIGTNWRIGKNSELLFNYSLSSRSPNAAELFSDGLHHSASAIELGDIQLKNEKSNKFIATLKNQFFNDKLNIELSGYYNVINDYISQIPVSAEYTNRGAFPVWQYTQTNAEIFGIDVDVNYSFLNNWNFQSIFSYIYGMDTKNDIALMNMPPANFINLIKYNNENWNDYFIKLTSRTVFRQNHYPNYNFSLPIIENGIEIYKILDISTPPSSYQLFDIESGFSINISDKNKIDISLSINNLANTSYRDYLNRLRYYSDEAGRNVIVKVKYNF